MTDLSTLEFLLMNYAAGTLGPFEGLMMASHLALNPRLRKKLSAYEAVGGGFIEKEEPAAVAGSCLQSVMDRIDAIESIGRGAEAQPAVMPLTHARASELGIPQPVHGVLVQACNDAEWQWSHPLPGVEVIDITLCPEKMGNAHHGHLQLIRALPQTATPRHSHAGLEITLLLEGSYTDETGAYRAGDIAIFHADPGFVHGPVSGADGCLCLVLNAAPVRFENPLYRFLSNFWGF